MASVDYTTEELLGAYLTGDVTDAERTAVEAWMSQNPGASEVAAELRAVRRKLKQHDLIASPELQATFRQKNTRFLAARQNEELIAAAVVGDVSPSEQKAVDALLATNAGAREIHADLATLTETLMAGQLSTGKNMTRALRERMAAKLPAAALKPMQPATPSQRLTPSMRIFIKQDNRFQRRLITGAAAAMVLLSVGVAGWKALNRTNSTNDQQPVGNPENILPPNPDNGVAAGPTITPNTPVVPPKPSPAPASSPSETVTPGKNLPSDIKEAIKDPLLPKNSPPAPDSKPQFATPSTPNVPTPTVTPNNDQPNTSVATPNIPFVGPQNVPTIPVPIPEVASGNTPSNPTSPNPSPSTGGTPVAPPRSPDVAVSPPFPNTRPNTATTPTPVPLFPANKPGLTPTNNTIPPVDNAAVVGAHKGDDVKVFDSGNNQENSRAYDKLSNNSVIRSGSSSGLGLVLPRDGRLYVSQNTDLTVSFSGSNTTITLRAGEFYYIAPNGGSLTLKAGAISADGSHEADVAISGGQLRISNFGTNACTMTSAKGSVRIPSGKLGFTALDGTDTIHVDVPTADTGAWRYGLAVPGDEIKQKINRRR